MGCVERRMRLIGMCDKYEDLRRGLDMERNGDILHILRNCHEAQGGPRKQRGW